MHADLKSVNFSLKRRTQFFTDYAKSNILVDNSHTARIGDFGLMSILRNPSISMSVSPPAEGGTYQWMAPELFSESSRPSKESDVYALGMVAYEVCYVLFPGDQS